MKLGTLDMELGPQSGELPVAEPLDSFGQEPTAKRVMVELITLSAMLVR